MEILRSRQPPLDVFFQPKTVAVIGATETPHSVGRILIENLIRQPFGGTVYPVNLKRPGILGIKSYPHIGVVEDQVELAVIAAPAPAVPGLIRECAEAHVKGAIIISAGFKETGAAGAALEHEVLKEARRGGLRVIGPNCLGVMRPPAGFNATFAAGLARPGSVGFISQSGALCTAILDWSLREHVGFSAFVSTGSMLDVGWGDLIDYLGDDPQTQSILIYMESIGDARAFLSAAREVALTKPIIVLKAGRSESAAKAAASHTGALAGSDDVLDAAFRRCGVLRVRHISELFYMADVLAKQPRPKGPRLSILTNAGGPGVLATDALIKDGGELAPLSAETLAQLNPLLPAAWSHSNPIDILGDAGPDRYAQALDVVAKDPKSDGMLVILTPQAMTDPLKTAESLQRFAQSTGRPLLASWMGGPGVEEGEALLARAGIPTFAYPDTAARAFTDMWRYTRSLKSLYETPHVVARSAEEAPDRESVQTLLKTVRAQGRTLLSEPESKELLKAYGIPAVETRVATREADAVKQAEKIGYPVVLKLYSKTITHKTDVGGVKLDLKNAAQVKAAFQALTGIKGSLGVTIQPMVKREGYELIIGSSVDAQFGPVLLFGSGGQLVEVYEDRSLGLPPLTTTLARRLMEGTRIYRALKGVRGRKPVDLAELEALLVRFSRLVTQQPWIKEIDINPLLASPQGFLALDARVVLHDPAQAPETLPKPAIRPYPAQYKSTWTMKDGVRVTLRPIRPEDEPLVAQFHETLSDESVYRRYMQRISLSDRVAHQRLVRVCFSDYDRTLALVVEQRDASSGARRILAIGRLEKVPSGTDAELAILVSDAQQRKGIGTHLVRRLLEVARQEKIRRVKAEILCENIGMQRIAKKLGFRFPSVPSSSSVQAEISL